MSALDDITASLAKFRTANRIDGTRASYQKDNKTEYDKVVAYLDGGARPSGVTTDMGMALLLEEDARRKLVPVSPPPPTGPAPPEAPRAPVTDRSNPSGLGFNMYEGSANIQDYTIHDTGDTAILLHGTQTNGVVRRVQISRLLNTVGWATHGMYVKSPNNLIEDIRVDNSQGNGASGITLRHPGNTVRRVKIFGGFQHPITYFENSGAAGSILIEDAELHYTNTQTCIYGDDSNGPPTPGLKQAFTLRRVYAFGPTSAKLIRLVNYTGGGVTLDNCYINGRLATMADVELIPL